MATASSSDIGVGMRLRAQRNRTRLVTALCVWAAVVLGACGPAPAAYDARTVRAQDRLDLAVTLYSDGFGLVEDTRQADLPQGVSTVVVPGVAPGLDLDSCSVTVAALAGAAVPTQGGQAPPAPVAQQPQVIQGDHMTLGVVSLTRAAVLRSYVGQEVEVELSPGRVVSGRLTFVEGSPERAWVVVDGKLYFVDPSSVALPVQNSLLPTPGSELTFRVTVPAAGRYVVRVSYLTSGMGWQGDYSLVLAESEKYGELVAWGSLENRTGLPFDDARVELIAGSVRRVSGSTGGLEGVAVRALAAAAPSPGGGESGLLPTFDYRTYQVAERCSLPGDGCLRVRMFQAARVSLKKVYFLQRSVSYGSESYLGKKETRPATVTLEIPNRKEAGLGYALMAGVVKIYRAKQDGSLTFLGEDSITDTPKDRTLYVTLGGAFDVTAERVKTDYRKLTADSYEEAYSIRLFNRKEEDVDVVVLERLPGDWAVLQSSPSGCYRKADAQTAEFRVKVPKGGQIEILYRVKVVV